MKKERIYKAHLLFTKEPGRFEVIENGYVAVSADGRVTGVAADLASVQRSMLNAQRLDSEEGIAMDLELLPWLQQYTFPRHFGWPPSRLAAFSARWEASIHCFSVWNDTSILATTARLSTASVVERQSEIFSHISVTFGAAIHIVWGRHSHRLGPPNELLTKVSKAKPAAFRP